MNPPLRTVARCLSIKMRVPFDELLGRRRTMRVAQARAILMAIGTDTLGLSSSVVGRILDREHSTVLHGAAIGRRLIQQSEFGGTVAAALAMATAEHADSVSALSAVVRNKPTNQTNLAA